MMNPNIRLILEVQNAHEQPKQMELLTHELAEMSTRLEESTDWTEEDQFIVHAFEGEHHGVDSQEARTFFAETVAELSLDFPDLVFALDVAAEDDPDSEPVLMRREYYQDGAQQVAYPQIVVADFNPEAAMKVIVEPEE